MNIFILLVIDWVLFRGVVDAQRVEHQAPGTNDKVRILQGTGLFVSNLLTF